MALKIKITIHYINEITIAGYSDPSLPPPTHPGSGSSQQAYPGAPSQPAPIHPGAVVMQAGRISRS